MIDNEHKRIVTQIVKNRGNFLIVDWNKGKELNKCIISLQQFLPSC